MTEEQAAEDLPLPGGNFRLLIQRLGYQGLMSLGIIENPLTDTTVANLDNARLLIDDLTMLQEKTLCSTTTHGDNVPAPHHQTTAINHNDFVAEAQLFNVALDPTLESPTTMSYHEPRRPRYSIEE